MYCIGCGNRLAPDSAYCHGCGEAVAAITEYQRRFAVLADAPVFTDPELASQIAVVPKGIELEIASEGTDSYMVRLPDGQSGYVRKSAGMVVRPRQTSQSGSGSPAWRPGGLEALLRTPGSAEAPSHSPTSDTVISAADGPSLQAACVTYLVINGLLVVSTFLPWERLGVLTASGLEFGRGWVILVVALAAAVVAEESLRNGRPVTGLRVAQWSSAAAALGMFVVEIVVIASACSGQEDQLFDFCIQPGLGVGAVLAGIGGLALGAAATFRHPRLDARFEASHGPRSIP